MYKQLSAVYIGIRTTMRLLNVFFKMGQDDAHISYITGNHDRDMMGLEGLDFSGITIKKQMIHTTHQQKKYLLIHGDKFDGVLNKEMMFLYTLGDHCYTFAVMLNYPINLLINLFEIEWSLSNYLKCKIKNEKKVFNFSSRCREWTSALCGEPQA